MERKSTTFCSMLPLPRLSGRTWMSTHGRLWMHRFRRIGSTNAHPCSTKCFLIPVVGARRPQQRFSRKDRKSVHGVQTCALPIWSALDAPVPKDRVNERASMLYEMFLDSCSRSPKAATAFLAEQHTLQKQYLLKSQAIYKSVAADYAKQEVLLSRMLFGAQAVKYI